MKKLPASFIDTVITDPPYGLGFMGKEWDRFKRAGVIKKPGHYVTRNANGSPVRHRKGFSSASAAGQYDYSRNSEFQQWFTFWAKECLRVAKPGAFLLCFGGTRTFHRLTCAIEDAGWQIRDCMMWLYGSGFPKSLDISKAIDKKAGAKRKVIGYKPSHRPNRVGGRSQSMAIPYTDALESIPSTNLAKLWDGYGTALKPAWEPIIVAMKPLGDTFAQNAEKYGVAGLWIDGGRIIAQQNDRFGGGGLSSPQKGFMANTQNTYQKGMGFRDDTAKGRWPANLILDEGAARMLDEQSGTSKSKASDRNKEESRTNTYGWAKGGIYKSGVHFSDSGGASRFFYCAKASKKERGPDNKHPTVKPLALMEYLCKLTKTPAGGVVLDPFGGSGTTALACLRTGRGYILIDKEEDYCKIAKRRIMRYRIEESKKCKDLRTKK